MTKLEQVLKGLACCDDTSRDTLNCEECPYNTDGYTCSAVAALHNDALELLKAQMPVKPIFKDDVWWCGNCKYAIAITSREVAKKMRNTHFCPQCGKKVDWDDEA